MPAIILLVLLLVFCLGPFAWVRMVMDRHKSERPDFPGTGGELARHLLDTAGLKEVPVEITDRGDHYDPRHKAVRLTGDNFAGRSLTAVAIAAHEVSHALQDRDGYAPLRLRNRLARPSHWLQMAARVLLMAAPLLIALSPRLAFVLMGLAVFVMLLRVVLDLVTLPVEFDASFERALPILDKGGFLQGEDLAAAREVLTAAAWTYVAGTLLSVINLVRWFRR